MSNIKSFTIYKEYYDLITLLDEEEKKGLSLAILEYMFENKTPVLNERQMKIFNNLKRPLDKSKNKSKSTSKLNQNEIKLKSNENQNEIKSKTHQDVDVNVNVYSEDNRGMGEEETLSPEEKEIVDFAEKHEMIITPNDFERLKFFIQKVSIEDIKDALLSGKDKPFNYTMTILRSRAKEKQEIKKRKEPDWIDKKIESKPMDEKTKKELEEFVNEFR